MVRSILYLTERKNCTLKTEYDLKGIICNSLRRKEEACYGV